MSTERTAWVELVARVGPALGGLGFLFVAWPWLHVFVLRNSLGGAFETHARTMQIAGGLGVAAIVVGLALSKAPTSRLSVRLGASVVVAAIASFFCLILAGFALGGM